MSPGWPSFSTACLSMTSIMPVPVEGKTWASARGGRDEIYFGLERFSLGTGPQVEPRVTETKTKSERRHERPGKDRQGDQQIRQHSATRHPGENSDSAKHVQHSEEQKQIEPGVLSLGERRKEIDRRAYGHAPHKLIVEPEVSNLSELRSDLDLAHAVVQRPSQPERSQRLERQECREQDRRPGRNRCQLCFTFFGQPLQ